MRARTSSRETAVCHAQAPRCYCIALAIIPVTTRTMMSNMSNHGQPGGQHTGTLLPQAAYGRAPGWLRRGTQLPPRQPHAFATWLDAPPRCSASRLHCGVPLNTLPTTMQRHAFPNAAVLGHGVPRLIESVGAPSHPATFTKVFLSEHSEPSRTRVAPRTHVLWPQSQR